jgi:hypothetical protein
VIGGFVFVNLDARHALSQSVPHFGESCYDVPEAGCCVCQVTGLLRLGRTGK